MTQRILKTCIAIAGILLLLVAGMQEARAQVISKWPWMTPGSFVTYNVFHEKVVPRNPWESFKHNWSFTWTVTAVTGTVLTIQEDAQTVQYDAFSRKNLAGSNYARWWLPKGQRMTSAIRVDNEVYTPLQRVAVKQDSWSRPAWQLVLSTSSERRGAAPLTYLHYDMGIGILLYYAVEYPDQFYRMIMNNTNTIPASALKAAIPPAALLTVTFTLTILVSLLTNTKRRRKKGEGGAGLTPLRRY